MSESAPAAAAKPPHPVKVLTDHFLTAYDYVHAGGRAYAVPKRDLVDQGQVEGPAGIAVELGSQMRHRIVRASARTSLIKVPITRTIADTVMTHLQARAFEGVPTELYQRFFHSAAERLVAIDLGRPDGACICIDTVKWTVAPVPVGVTFQRSHTMGELPLPIPEGTPELLSLALQLDKDSEEFRAMIGWLISVPFVDSVRPGLLLHGAPGSGKSTRLRLLASVLEPSSDAALGSSFGRNAGDDQVRALHRPVPLWDNLTQVSASVSDELCTLVTGTARETRALFTDNDLNATPVRRPVGLTAVGVPAGLQPDALERLISVEVPQIERYMPDAAVQANFDALHPLVLGGLCNVIAMILATERAKTVPTPPGHRMGAHVHRLAIVDTAVTRGLWHLGPGGLLEAYAAAALRTTQAAVAEDGFGGALLTLLERSAGGEWQGKASELLQAVKVAAPYTESTNGPGWPQSARRVPVVLNQMRAGLASLGVTWHTTTVRGSTRFYLKRGGSA